MFLTLQFPFADLRHFLGPGTGRLEKPKISVAQLSGKEFIRSSGPIRRRHKGGTDDWSGEEVFADGKFGLRFPNHLDCYTFGTAGFYGKVVDTFRRFHLNGVVARFEVCLEMNVTADGGDFMPLLRDVLSIPMHERYRQRNSEQKSSKKWLKEVELFNVEKLLAQHYLAATTTQNSDPPINIQSCWLSAGTPAVFVEYPLSSRLVMPRYTKHILDVPEAAAEVSYSWLTHKNKNFGVWFIGTKEREDGYLIDSDARRRLRLNLTHLHAERECLSLVMANCGTENDYTVVDNKRLERAQKFAAYLHKTAEVLFKTKRYGISQLSFKAYDISYPGRTASLSDTATESEKKINEYLDHAKRIIIVRENSGGLTMQTTSSGRCFNRRKL